MTKHLFVANENYHLYNRGVEKRVIFLDEADHKRFVKTLFFCNGTKPFNDRNSRKGLTFAEAVDKRGERLVDIGAYCLMPNHFHLLIRENQEGGISTFMQKVLTAYTMYFNVKYERKGRLFESSFKSTHAGYDQYLKYLFSYVHLNPMKLLDRNWRDKSLHYDGLSMKHLSSYPFSSFLDYLGEKRDENHLLNRETFPEYFPTPEAFTREIQDWLSTDLLEVRPRG